MRRIIAEQPGYIQYHISPSHLTNWKDGAEYYLTAAKGGNDPFAGSVKGVRPFRSKVDNQLLLYRYTLPKDYDPAKKYPLRVDPHSGGGFLWLAGWVDGKPAPDGAIHIAPGGSTSGWARARSWTRSPTRASTSRWTRTG